MHLGPGSQGKTGSKRVNPAIRGIKMIQGRKLDDKFFFQEKIPLVAYTLDTENIWNKSIQRLF
jgi:hypothetical protein